jgi:Mesyanzhinovviridae DNA helicase
MQEQLTDGDIFTVKGKFIINQKTSSFAHQIIGTQALIDHEAFALFDEMGAGKSKQVIDAACLLAECGKIDTVVVVCPASVRSVWCDAEIGEIKKHSWTCNHVFEFHAKSKVLWGDLITKGCAELMWCITNYEFLRGEKHLSNLVQMLNGRKCLLVLDESSYIKSRTTAQTKAIIKLRQHCARCVILNGTPIVNNPMDLWSQMAALDKGILGQYFHNFWQFRAEYCEMVTQRFNGHSFQKIARYRRLDDLNKKIAPYVLRRLKKDCMDLPEKLYTQREVPLSNESWERYKTLRKEAVISLGNGDLRLEPNAAVRIMRLVQLTSGILGGTDIANMIAPQSTQDLSSEKLDWCVHYLTEECTARYVIVWCRWRRERERLYVELCKQNKRLVYVRELYGGQSKERREDAIQLFSRPDDIQPSGALSILLAQPHAGGFGLNLVAATECIYLSNDWSYGIRLQSEDRCHRPGQKNAVLYQDVLATGPTGQRTIDHIILKALRDKANLAEMTTGAWRRALTEKE